MWWRSSLFGCLALLSQGALADVQQGLKAYQAGDYGLAHEAWRGDALAGDPLAQFLLGHLFERGLGVREDLVQAYRWYAMAAAQNNKDAQIARDSVELRMSPEDLAEARSGLATDQSGRGPVDQVPAAGSSLEDSLRAAVERGDVGLVAELLETGGDPSLRFSDGEPLLLRAIKRSHGDVALALMSSGADIFAADKLGWTPLMTAIFGGQYDLAAILLEQQADPDHAARDGTTARALAAQREQAELLALMGAPVMMPSDLPPAPPAPLPTAKPEPAAQREPAAQPEPAVVIVAERPQEAPPEAPPEAQPVRPAAPAVPTREAIIEAQSRLARLGYDPGLVDGAMGPRTRSAILAFQRDQEAVADGQVTDGLLRNLRAAERPAPAASPAAAAWSAVEESQDPADIAGYLRAYPNGPFADQARTRLFQLNAGLWSVPQPGGGPKSVPQRDAETGARSQGRQALSDPERYLVERRALFHAQLNAYNKRHEIKPSGNRSTFKGRDLYEATAIGQENGITRVEVLIGVGNWQGQAQNADLNIARLIVLLRPSGGGFRIVGHSEDPGARPPAR